MSKLRIDSRKVLLCLARKEMSRSELCNATGITSANFSIILKRGTVKEKTAGKISKALGVDISEILQPEQEVQNEN